MDTTTGPDLTSAAARAALDAGEAKARELGSNMVMALVDDHGVLKAFRRMDGAPFLSVALALDKAYTTAVTGLASDALGAEVANDPPRDHGLRYVPRLLMFEGGYPIRVDGELAGAVAVGGGRTAHDVAVAAAVVDAAARG
jgi:uncharacterized protein GlcG (DUF336 family)